MAGLDLNNRDVATLFWMSVFTVLALFVPQVRAGLPGLLRQLVACKISLPIVLLAGWAALWVYLGSRVGLWTQDLLKDTVVWYLVSGLGLLFSLNTALKQRSFWKRTALGLVGANVLVAFLVNIDEVVFPIVVELLLQPIVVLLAGMAVVAAKSEEARRARGCITGLEVFLGAAVVLASIVRLAIAWPGIDKGDLLLTALLPVWLTLAALPYLYVLVTLAAYEVAFGRINSVSAPSGGARRAKVALVAEFRGNPHAVSELGGKSWAWKAVHASSVREARSNLHEQRRCKK